MDLQTILFLVSGGLAIISTLFGVKHAQIKKALKETKDVVIVMVDAFDDDKIDSQETEAFMKEGKEMLAAWGFVFKKKA